MLICKKLSGLGLVFALVAGFTVQVATGQGADQSPPYTEGSVWNVTFVRTVPGSGDAYLRNLAAGWKKVMEEGKREGLVLSYKIISSSAANRDDWDLMLLVESKNWAAFDGSDEKFRAISRRIFGSQQEQQTDAQRRNEIREILGAKVGQELILK